VHLVKTSFTFLLDFFIHCSANFDIYIVNSVFICKFWHDIEHFALELSAVFAKDYSMILV